MANEIKDDIPYNFIRTLDDDMTIPDSADIEENINFFEGLKEENKECYIGTTKTCKNCGKVFFVRDCRLWAYVRHYNYFCKWSCLTQYDKKIEEQKKKHRKEVMEKMRKNRAEKAKNRRAVNKEKGDKNE